MKPIHKDATKARYQEPLMTLQATHHEVIALGMVLNSYLRWLSHHPSPTSDEVMIARLLEGFYDRLAAALPTCHVKEEGQIEHARNNCF